MLIISLIESSLIAGGLMGDENYFSGCATHDQIMEEPMRLTASSARGGSGNPPSCFLWAAIRLRA
jgi:hypothetical protein